ncbi:UNVERIFIED_CONTAM: hypothetical protein RKD43_000630 [Streptomyces graminofaciens]
MTGTSGEDGRAIRRDTERVVNEVAQQLSTLDDGTAWFTALSPAGRTAVLGGCAMQAHITTAYGHAGVARSGVKPTANPSVMICMDPPRYGFAALPSDEHVKAFRVLVPVFSAADARRRQTYGKGTCRHAWHDMVPAAEGPKRQE